MKIVSQLSGGLDSILSTLYSIKMADECFSVFFDYGQIYAEQEYKAATKASDIFLSRYKNYHGLHKLNLDISTQVHVDTCTDDFNKDYVPIRNLVLGTISANKAIANSYDTVSVGSKTIEVRLDDSHSFADCSVSFYNMLSNIVTYASENKKIKFIMPLIKSGKPLSKKQVIEELISEGISPSIAWSCYNAGKKYCGDCYHCEEIKKTGYWSYFN